MMTPSYATTFPHVELVKSRTSVNCNRIPVVAFQTSLNRGTDVPINGKPSILSYRIATSIKDRICLHGYKTTVRSATRFYRLGYISLVVYT